MKSVFTSIYTTNYWSKDCKSGDGATDNQTKEIREEIPKLLIKYNIQSVLDCPCGDLNYIKKLFNQIPFYTGGDIVQQLIEQHKKTYLDQKFINLDICKDIIPENDLILCRDLLVHFKFTDIFTVIRNIKRSKCKYLLTTTFTKRITNHDINQIGYEWRPLNLEIPPFSFPKPLYIINENCTEGNNTYNDKSLGLWEIEKLPDN